MQLNVQTAWSEQVLVTANVQLAIVVNASGAGNASLQAVRAWNFGPMLQMDIFDVDMSSGVPALTLGATQHR